MEFIVSICITLLVLYLLKKTFEPHIDVIITGKNSFKVLLFYNHFEGPEISRRYKVIFEKET